MGKVIMSGIVPQVSVPVVATPISEFAEGSIVKLNESGSPVEFYVAKHDYESGLNGTGRTLLVRKECYDTRVWDSSGTNTYYQSSIDTWLNSNYFALLDSEIRTAMGSTLFYYTPYSGGDVTRFGRQVFLLSVTELGKTASYANVEGTALPIANTLQTTGQTGWLSIQWTRSPSIDSTANAFVMGAGGSVSGASVGGIYGSRPCFTLPSTIMVDKEGTVVV